MMEQMMKDLGVDMVQAWNGQWVVYSVTADTFDFDLLWSTREGCEDFIASLWYTLMEGLEG